eukprot:m.57338 g.57338  ORF g.57338 m.57338 type:complete len:329 (-) comp18872_c0_seq2:96-1082(-)
MGSGCTRQMSATPTRVARAPTSWEDEEGLPVITTTPFVSHCHNVIDQLGKGAFGSVYAFEYVHYDAPTSNCVCGSYAAQRLENQPRELACKKVDRTAQQEDRLLLREARVMLALTNHQNIVTLSEVLSTPTAYLFVMDRCSGGDLFSCVNAETLPSVEDARRAMTCILNAVKFCHEKNIIHRNIALENVMFCDQTRDFSSVQLIDFGTARVLQPNELCNEVTGGLAYLAPEVWRRRYDFKADIFSCGVCLYMLLSGTPPFDGGSEEVIIHKICEGHVKFPAQPWKHLPAASKECVKSLLEFYPQKRPTADQGLRLDFFRQIELDSSSC